MDSMIEAGLFRAAMSRFAAAVHIVTTDGAAGRRGVTATSVASVSDAPATLLVCLNTSNEANQRFEANGCFAVNLLADESEGLARVFAGEGALSPEARFAEGEWGLRATGAPILEDALASFDCRLIDSRIVATHRVMIGEVRSIHLGAERPCLVYHGRAYHRV
ncbi:flavin reductase family protein [Aureimonas sp. SA4125]|uniref:flavin reductase family protein n=1 Tax=Aureimonas sp. SA4125 TaxID=2826993 RepID=UPI001CC6001A|nr:flavin reductase family protein [Aureimonas sp. SA4125]